MDLDTPQGYVETLVEGDLFTIFRDVNTHRVDEWDDTRWLARLDKSIKVLKGTPLIALSMRATVYRTRPPDGLSERDEEFYAESVVHVAYTPEGDKVVVLNSDTVRY